MAKVRPPRPPERRPVSTIAAHLLSVWVLTAAACGGDGAIDPCRGAPTYAEDIRPLSEAACLSCHSEARAGAARQGAPEALNYDSFALIEPNLLAFANAFTSGTMPPPDSGLSVSSSDRSVVSSWRRCGFPP